MSENKVSEIEAPSLDNDLEYSLHLPRSLNIDEKKYLLAVERGDLANVRRMLQLAHKIQNKKLIDINCVDSLGRGALTLAIESENLEMLELLVVMGVETRDSLLYAIDQEFVEAVELLLEHEELVRTQELNSDNPPKEITHSWQMIDPATARYPPEMTPLVVAAQRNNYEILKLLLDRGATLPMPHDIRCGCDDCLRSSTGDPLRLSSSRISEYKALASPSLIALSSPDPIMTAFQLSWELRQLAISEPESSFQYIKLQRQVEKFAVDLLQQSRTTSELNTILNHDPEADVNHHPIKPLARLEAAIQYKQKKFVSHSHVQQLLASIWYEGVPGFRRMTALKRFGIIIKTAILFPLYSMIYYFAPNSKNGQLLRRPFMKFLIHASSYLLFLLILMLVSLRAEFQAIMIFGTEKMKRQLEQDLKKQRGSVPTFLECIVVIYVFGFIWEETRQVFCDGLKAYLRDMWNFIDFTRNSLYVATGILRIAAYVQQRAEINEDSSAAYVPRERWSDFDPQLIAEGLFSAANIFSALKIIHLFSINQNLGPLQISLGRMVIDIVKFFFIYTLVLFAFACGLNQLLWYFAELEKIKCYSEMDNSSWDPTSDSCLRWRRFSSLFESCQSLFWASFGGVGIDSFDLTGIKSYTRFWGLLMFGSYSVINVIVLLNLLIAMMSNSYAIIEKHSDVEWKFARTKLWMSYFDYTQTLPPPFNIFPAPKFFLRLIGLQKKSNEYRSSGRRKAREHKYSAVMRALIWRYIVNAHNEHEMSPVTEDDIHEVKSDISSWRCELLEVLRRNGMDITGANAKEQTVLGKKMRIWERRLMNDFSVSGPMNLDDCSSGDLEQPPEGEDNIERWKRVAKLAVLKSADRKWGQIVSSAVKSSQIGRSNNRVSLQSQQSLKKAMDEARKMRDKPLLPELTPVKLPEEPTANILHVIKGTNTPTTPRSCSPEPTETKVEREANVLPTTVGYENEKTKKNNSQFTDSRRSSPPKIIKRKLAPSSPSNLNNNKFEKSPGKIIPTTPNKNINNTPGSHLTTDIVRPRPRPASPRKIPDMTIIPNTPEFNRSRQNDNQSNDRSPRINIPRRNNWI